MTQQRQNIDIIINNCNSIDHAEISIVKGSLNIKYGLNGVGKSTIAKAIVSHIRADTLNHLIPFKNRDKVETEHPKVEGIDDFKSALVFDEDYVNQFVFQQDEVIKNSFEIFIKTHDYDSTIAEIEELFLGIKKAFANTAEIEQTTKDLKDLRDAFGDSNKDGSIPKSSKILKAFGLGNKIENIPDFLQPFETFIKSSDPSKWMGWQIKGNDFLKLGNTCPYCSTELSSEPQKEIALAVAKAYDVNSIGHLNTLKAVIERLGKYFSEKCQKNLEKITKAKFELTTEQKSFLSELKNNINVLIEKLEMLRTISFFSLRDVNIDEKVELLRIDLGMIDKLNSEETRKVTDPINVQLEELIKKLGTLKGIINKHKAKIKKTIEENQKSINDFLHSAGYKYTVKISDEPDSYKMKIIHNDLKEHIELASKHLSFGEKNAFSLVLFMHQVLSENPDIVVLDDPISSFDKNKKFAILNKLFQGKASLKGRTTIMLTHDIEPVIDIIKTTNIFNSLNSSATFLTSNSGQVKETHINHDDIQTFTKICKENIDKLTDSIIKTIYLRRYYEILDGMGVEYNILASLFKKRDNPTIKSAGGGRDMTADEKAKAEVEIKKHIADFDYDHFIAQVKDDALLMKKFFTSQTGYEKIQLFRIIRGQHPDNVIAKFINESYHIENEYVMQLNPCKFESVPEYVIQECTNFLKELQNKNSSTK